MKRLIFVIVIISISFAANAQNIVADKITINGTGSAGDISVMSARTEISGTFGNLRTLASRFGEKYDVLDWGIDPTGMNDSTLPFQNLASLAAANASSSGVSNAIYFPPGNYKITSSVYLGPSTILQTGAGVKFIGNSPSVAGVPNTIADQTVLQKGTAGNSVQRYSTSSINDVTLYLSQVQGATSGSASFEKTALYAGVLNYDSSAYTRSTAYDTMSYYKDATGADLRGTIAPGNSIGRAWGATIGAIAGSAANTDGLMVGLEVDMQSDVTAPAQSEYNRFNSKTGVLVVNLASKQVTTAMLVTSATAPFYDGITVAKNAVSRNAFQLIDFSAYPARIPFSVDATGNTSVTSLIMASYNFASLPTANTAGRQVLCSNCRKPGESAGNGTGMLVFDDGHAHWVSTAGTIAAQ